MKMFARNLIRKFRAELINFLKLPPNYIGDNGCIRAAASFAAWNQIEGDYLEFGVWNGYSFTAAYHEILNERKNHFRLGYNSPKYNQWKNNPPRFFAFDSFSGLPNSISDNIMIDYQPGSYACSENQFLSNLRAQSVSLDDIVTVKGFYQQTCKDETKHQHKLIKAAIVMIDCDLYESTVPVLDFLTDIVQQGTIIIFDDWFRFKGDSSCGEQRACREWLDRNPQIELIEFWRQGPQAVSFIVNTKDENTLQ